MSSKAKENKKVSLDPLSPEEALGGFMEVDPEQIREAEEREKQDKKNRKKQE